MGSKMSSMKQGDSIHPSKARRVSRPIGWGAACFAASLAPFFLAGCGGNEKKPTTRPSTIRERQEAALKDPFNYSPNKDFPDVSGGGLGDFDKEGMKRDVDRVFNP